MPSYQTKETVPCMVQFVDGTWSYPRAGIVRQLAFSGPNKVSRPRPATLNIENGTSRTVSSWSIHSSSIFRSVRLQLNPTPIYGGEITVVGDHVPLGAWSDPLQYETSLETQVMNAMRAKARGMVVNLGNVLGEYRKTAKTFSDLLTEFVRLTLAVKHRDPRILLYGYYNPYGRIRKGSSGFAWSVKIQRDISAQWLQYVYGIKPLMQDADKAMRDLREHADKSAPRIRVTATRRSKVNPIRTVVNSYWDTSIKCVRTEWSYKVVRGVADVDVRNDILKSSLGAYGLTNPLSIAWELMPFSFIVDWWVNVGELIESLDNSLYFDGTSSAQTSVDYTQYAAGEVLGKGGLYKSRTYSRSAPKGLGTLAVPRLKTDPSLLHLANGLALARTLLRG